MKFSNKTVEEIATKEASIKAMLKVITSSGEEVALLKELAIREWFCFSDLLIANGLVEYTMECVWCGRCYFLFSPDIDVLTRSDLKKGRIGLGEWTGLVPSWQERERFWEWVESLPPQKVYFFSFN